MPNEEEIERTMTSIDTLQRAEAPAFFYTRLQARLEQPQRPRGAWLLAITRPAVSFTTLALLVALNVAVIIRYVRASKSTGTAQAASGLQQFAAMYNLDGTSLFTEKTDEP